MDGENRDALNAAAREAFSQAGEGYAVPLDPELATGMGAFPEVALSLTDVQEDQLHRQSEDANE